MIEGVNGSKKRFLLFTAGNIQYIYPEMQHSKRDLDYAIPKRISQTSILNPKYIF
jgi:hypothetical protein